MRTMLLQGVFVGGELEGARKQWPCVLKSTHPLTERLEIPPFGGRPLFVESLDSKIDRTKMPRSAFEPSVLIAQVGSHTTWGVV